MVITRLATTITYLRHDFQEWPALMLWQIFGVCITASMLGDSLRSTGYAGMNLDPALPAWCHFHPSGSQKSFLWERQALIECKLRLSRASLRSAPQLVWFFLSSHSRLRTDFVQERLSNIVKGWMASARFSVVRSLAIKIVKSLLELRLPYFCPFLAS